MFMSTRYKKKDPAWRGRPLFALDDSLAKLFDCLTIEYCCNKLISPKWKDFRNQKLRFEHKTRLNNAIWRAWHIQYKLNSKPRFCQFEAPFSDQSAHSTPQAVILEGRYWKKRLDMVSYEYLRWRKPIIYKGGDKQINDVEIPFGNNKPNKKTPTNAQKRPRGIDVTSTLEQKPPFSMSNTMSDQEMIIDSFTAVSHLPDTLFSSLEPQPKVSSSATDPSYVPFTDSSDTIQPTLDHLNPCLDDLMENFDFFAAAMWNDFQCNPLYTLPEEQKDAPELMNIDQSNDLTQTNTSRYEQAFGKDNNYSISVSHPEYTLNNIHTMAENRHQTSHPTAINQQTTPNPMQSSNLPINGKVITSSNPLAASGTANNIPSEPADQFRKQVFDAFSELPPKLQAPNLAAHLQASGKAKFNSTAEEIVDVTTITQPKELMQSRQLHCKQSTSTKSRRSALPRNRSDSSLIQIEAQSRKEASVRERRRCGSKSSDGNDKGNIHRNLSDPSLSSLSNSSRRTPHILPKGLLAAVPIQQSMIMPICPPGIYPGQGPTLLVQPQPPGNNEPGHATLYMPKSAGVPLVKRNTKKALSNIPILQAQSKCNPPINPNPPNQCDALQLFSNRQLTNLKEVLEKGNTSTDDAAKQLAYLEQLQQQVNDVLKEKQKQIITYTQQHSIDEPMTSRRPSPIATCNTNNPMIESPVHSPGVMQQSFNQNSVTYILPPQSRVESMQIDQHVQISSPPKPTPRQPSYTQSPQPAIVSLGEGVYLQLDDANRQSVNHIVGIPNAFSNTITATTPSCSSMVCDGSDVSMSNTSRSSISTVVASNPPLYINENSAVFTAPRVSSSSVSGNQASRNSSRRQQPNTPDSDCAILTKRSDLLDDGYCRKENRRRSHITSEQRRRGSIKAALDEFLEIIPLLKNQQGGKVSKAVILQKSISYIVQLQTERKQMTDKLDLLKAEIKGLNDAIQDCQQQLPASGASMNNKKEDLMNESFINYVKSRIQQNRSFWIFGIILRPLFESFQAAVSTATVQEFLSSLFEWLEKSCSLPALRPVVSASLRQFCSCSAILTDPSKIEEQAINSLNYEDPTSIANEENHVNQSIEEWDPTTIQHHNEPTWTFHSSKSTQSKQSS